MIHYRATALSIGNQAVQFAARHNAEILTFQRQISSGVKLQRSSDDPIAFRHATALQTQLGELTAELGAIETGETLLNTSLSRLQEANDLITRARSLAQQGVQATGESERDALAVEAEGLLRQLKNIAVSRFSGSYLFGGTRTDQAPFEFSESEIEGAVLNSTYLGADVNGSIHIGNSLSIDNFYQGDSIFGSVLERGQTVVYGQHGIQPGGGTDNVVGRTTVELRHGATTFLGGSGLANGTDAAALNTIIGPVGTHEITIVDESGTGDFGTISINGGPETRFDNLSTNLLVEGVAGERVYVDTTGITAGFNGTIALESTGTVSTDGGISQTNIDFSDNQVITNSVTGQFVTLNTTEVRLAGESYLEFPGTSDLFQTLDELITDLRNGRGLGNQDLADSLDRRIAELESHSDNILHVVGQKATSLAVMEGLKFRNQDLSLEVQTKIVDIQATDIPTAVVRLENAQSLLQYTYAVTAQINSLGILQFLN